MNNRIKELRKNLGLSQKEFAERLGISDVAVSRIENKNRNITNQMFLAVCREFGVNEEWLKSGKGEMFKNSLDSEFDFLREKYNFDNFETALIKKFVQLKREDRNVLINYIKSLIPEFEKSENDGVMPYAARGEICENTKKHLTAENFEKDWQKPMTPEDFD